MDYFEKKQWIRITVCTVLLILAVLAMIGLIGNESEPLIYDPAKVSGAVEAEAAEKGFAGDVTVHVSLDGKTVKALTIDTPDETEGLGKRASEAAFTDQFIGKEAPFTFGENGIEALSGATVTSEAALKAINKAAGAENTEEKAPEATEAPAEQPAETATEAPAQEPAPEATEEPAAEETAETPAPEITEEKAPAAGEEPKAEEAAAEAPAQKAPQSAAYKAVAKNDFSTVTVIASAKNGELTDVKILSEGEKGMDLLTDEIRAAWAKAILESGSAAPDAITGASLKFSAASVQEAMTEILEKIN